MTDEENSLLKFIVNNWDNVSKISQKVWKKVTESFAEGNKDLGFVKRPSVFNEYLALSKSTFIRRYSKYIIPTEYRGYLLESIIIARLYRAEKKDEADRKREKLSKTGTNANRICNLYTSGVLSIVFSSIDDLVATGLSDSAITGHASKLIDDLLNNKSIIYVPTFKDEDSLYKQVKFSAMNDGYCLVYGSSDQNIDKIKKVLNKIMDDGELDKFETRQSKYKVGKVMQLRLLSHKETLGSKFQ